MASRLTDKQKKTIIAEYAENGSYNLTAKKCGVSDKTVKRVVEENPDFPRLVEEKKRQNTADILEHMEKKRDVVCQIMDKYLIALLDDGRIEKSTPSQLTTALGTLIDKFTATGAIGTSREDDPLSKSLEELAKKGLKSDDK